jgi:primosomal protein N' (replication factor Y)
MPIVQVALDVPLDRLFDYEAPGATREDIGRRVKVPFGKDEKVGIIATLSEQSDMPRDRLKIVREIWRDIPPLSADDFQLLKFCSGYYHHPLGPVIVNALPPGLRRASGWVPPKRVARHDPVEIVPAPDLTDEQERSVATVLSRLDRFQPYLLKGVTGSGKTEVYLKAIEKIVHEGGQALVLVPEINLTPQFEKRFRERLPNANLVSLHSGLGEKERVSRWLAAQRGDAQVILGTRLAVFCPAPRLGLVIVDEEHDPSYKQQEGLRYSARDLAVVRAQLRDVPVLLGSATPSLESWWNAKAGRYHLLSLQRRAQPGSKMPTVRLIRTDPARHPRVAFSPEAIVALRQRLARGEQSLVFINRRGYSPVLLCSQCGWVCGCSRCSARMVVHLRAHQMRCHHCGELQSIPRHCPECGNVQLGMPGMGTQRIESELREQFPGARILRVDSDTLERRNAWRQTADAITSGEADILVGTQVLVKGHDFPGITLVVALETDSGLYSSDFRGSEHLFSQLVQVAGRAGRAERPGEVLIQTAFPEHPLLNAVLEHDYEHFASLELDQRRMVGFPPFTHQAVLRASSEKPAILEKFMVTAAESARLEARGITVFDPVPARLQRVAGKTRWQLLVQSENRPRLQNFLTRWQSGLAELGDSRISWVLDVDPMEL